MKSRYIVTVDVEGHPSKNPANDLIYGRIGDKVLGIGRIMDIFEQFSVKGIFFVDFAAIKSWGFESIKSVCDSIAKRGFDVQIHLHPEHFDPQRLFLFQYGYEEQKKMIEFCYVHYIKISDKMPVAFRAGRYAANENTLRVLNELNFKYDFSFFYKKDWCKLNKVFNSMNKLVKYNNIIEIPVTVFQERILDKYFKIDINSINRMEIKKIFRSSSEKLQYCVIFLHSFSFIHRYKNGLKLLPDYYSEKILISIFEEIKKYGNYEYFDTGNLEIKEEDLDKYEDSCIYINSFWVSLIGIFHRYKRASIRNTRFRKYFILFYLLTASLILLILNILRGCLK